jgi:hypothetical protein
MLIIQPETQRVDQMKPYLSRPTKAGDIPGVGGYLGPVEDHMKKRVFNNAVFRLCDFLRHRTVSNNITPFIDATFDNGS